MAIVTQIDSNTFELQEYSSKDENLVPQFNIETSLTQSSYIEFFTYDLNNNLINSNINFRNYSIINDSPSTGDGISQFNITPENDILSQGYNEGKYIAYYNFLNKKIGDPLSTLFISEISSDRTEIRLDSNVLSNLDIVEQANNFINFRENQDYFVDFYLNLGDNNLLIANNIQLENETTDDPTILIKLYEPLPSIFSLKSTLWVVTIINESLAFQVDFPVEPVVFIDYKPLEGPNFAIPVKNEVNNSSQNLSYNDIIGGASTNSTNQINSLLSESAVNISVDYNNFSDFIHFSSAQTRIENFYYKVELIETYTSESTSLSNITGSSTSQLIFDEKIKNVITNFDKFEYFMYYSSGSAAYPKLVTGVGERATSLPPYTLLSTKNPEVLTWLGSTNENSGNFGGLLLSASNYDNSNPDQLLKTIPEYLREDPNNQQYDLFIDMVAQYYDTVWLYTKDITQKYNADNRLDFGISKDLVSDAIKDFGVKLYQNNFSNQELYTAFLGITPNGSLFPYPEASFTTPVPTGKEFIDNIILPQGNVGALSPIDNQLSSSISYPPSGETDYANNGVPGVYTLLVDNGIISVTKGQGATLQFTVAANGSISNITTILGGSGYKVGDRILLNDNETIPAQGGGYAGTIEFLLQEKDILDISSVISLDDANKSLYKRIYHNIPYLLNSKGTLTGLRALITSYGIPDTILRISEFGGKDQVNANDYDLYQNNFNYAYNRTDINNNKRSISTDWALNSAWGTNNSGLYRVPNTVQFRFKVGDTPPSTSTFPANSSTLWVKPLNPSDVNGSIISLEYEGTGLTSSSLYDGSIKDPNYQYAHLKFYPDGDGSNSTYSASVYLPFYNGDWWSVMVTSGSSKGFELFSGNKIYNGNDGTSIGYYASSSISTSPSNVGWGDTSKSSKFGHSSIIDGEIILSISGAYQEIRYYNTIISESVFKDYIMNPLSFEGNGINSAPDQLAFRAALGSELDITTISSIHPKVTGSWDLTSSFATNSNFQITDGTVTPSYSKNTEYFFLDQPAVGIKNRTTDKIRSENDTLPSGNVLSSIRSLSQTIEASASYTDNVNYLEVAFSPQNQINDDIIGQMGHFNIGDYIGDPSQRFSGNNYPDLNNLSEDYFKKYIKQYDLVDFVRLIKFFDNSLFKMIKDFIPARTSLASGLVIKQHLLERNKYKQPTVNSEEILETGSIDMVSINGGAAGVLNPYNVSYDLDYQSGSTPIQTNVSGSSTGNTFNNLDTSINGINGTFITNAATGSTKFPFFDNYVISSSKSYVPNLWVELHDNSGNLVANAFNSGSNGIPFNTDVSGSGELTMYASSNNQFIVSNISSNADAGLNFPPFINQGYIQTTEAIFNNGSGTPVASSSVSSLGATLTTTFPTASVITNVSASLNSVTNNFGGGFINRYDIGGSTTNASTGLDFTLFVGGYVSASIDAFTDPSGNVTDKSPIQVIGSGGTNALRTLYPTSSIFTNVSATNISPTAVSGNVFNIDSITTNSTINSIFIGGYISSSRDAFQDGVNSGSKSPISNFTSTQITTTLPTASVYTEVSMSLGNAQYVQPSTYQGRRFKTATTTNALYEQTFAGGYISASFPIFSVSGDTSVSSSKSEITSLAFDSTGNTQNLIVEDPISLLSTNVSATGIALGHVSGNVFTLDSITTNSTINSIFIGGYISSSINTFQDGANSGSKSPISNFTQTQLTTTLPTASVYAEVTATLGTAQYVQPSTYQGKRFKVALQTTASGNPITVFNGGYISASSDIFAVGGNPAISSSKSEITTLAAGNGSVQNLTVADQISLLSTNVDATITGVNAISGNTFETPTVTTGATTSSIFTSSPSYVSSSGDIFLNPSGSSTNVSASGRGTFSPSPVGRINLTSQITNAASFNFSGFDDGNAYISCSANINGQYPFAGGGEFGSGVALITSCNTSYIEVSISGRNSGYGSNIIFDIMSGSAATNDTFISQSAGVTNKSAITSINSNFSLLETELPTASLFDNFYLQFTASLYASGANPRRWAADLNKVSTNIPGGLAGNAIINPSTRGFIYATSATDPSIPAAVFQDGSGNATNMSPITSLSTAVDGIRPSFNINTTSFPAAEDFSFTIGSGSITNFIGTFFPTTYPNPNITNETFTIYKGEITDTPPTTVFVSQSARPTSGEFQFSVFSGSKTLTPVTQIFPQFQPRTNLGVFTVYSGSTSLTPVKSTFISQSARSTSGEYEVSVYSGSKTLTPVTQTFVEYQPNTNLGTFTVYSGSTSLTPVTTTFISASARPSTETQMEIYSGSISLSPATQIFPSSSARTISNVEFNFHTGSVTQPGNTTFIQTTIPAEVHDRAYISSISSNTLNLDTHYSINPVGATATGFEFYNDEFGNTNYFISNSILDISKMDFYNLNPQYPLYPTVTQSFPITTPSILGDITRLHWSQDEFYNGEFSGSIIIAEDGELNPNCDRFKNPKYIGANYKLRTYNSSTSLESDFINPSNNPTPGHISIFVTSTSSAPSITVPTVTTGFASGITSTAMFLNATVTSDGGGTITERGFYFGTNSNYTSNPKTIVSGTTGTYGVQKSSLTPSTTYYFTGYAVNSGGEGIGTTTTQGTNSAQVKNTPTGFKVYHALSGNTASIGYYNSATTDFKWLWNEGINNGTTVDISSSLGTGGYTRLLPTNQFGDVIYDFDLNNISVVQAGGADVTSEWNITKEGGSAVDNPDRIKFERNANAQVLTGNSSTDNIYLNFDITSSIVTAGTAVIGDASFNIKPAIDSKYPYVVSGITASLYNKFPEFNISSNFYSLNSTLSGQTWAGNNYVYATSTSVKTFSNGYSAAPTAVESSPQFRNGVGSDWNDGSSQSLDGIRFITAGGNAIVGGSGVTAWAVEDGTSTNYNYFSISISSAGFLEIGYNGSTVPGLTFFWVYFYVQDLDGNASSFTIPKIATSFPLYNPSEYKIFAVKVRVQ